MGYNVTFCHDRLFTLNEGVEGGLDAFASKAKELVSQHGPAPMVNAYSDYTEYGLLSVVTLTWTTSTGEERSVSINKNQGRESASSGFGAFDILCR